MRNVYERDCNANRGLGVALAPVRPAVQEELVRNGVADWRVAVKLGRPQDPVRLAFGRVVHLKGFAHSVVSPVPRQDFS